MQHTLIIKKYKTKVFKEIINTFQKITFFIQNKLFTLPSTVQKTTLYELCFTRCNNENISKATLTYRGSRLYISLAAIADTNANGFCYDCTTCFIIQCHMYQQCEKQKEVRERRFVFIVF